MARLATVWNGEGWTVNPTYKKTCDCYRFGGRVLWIDPKVWKLPTFDISDNSPFTGSKVENHDLSIQVRFTVNTKNEELKNYVRRYILGVAREKEVAKNGTEAAMLLNLQIVGNNFTFESSFCGSASPIAGFLRALKEYDGESFKMIYFRYRNETNRTISKWYRVKFESEEAFRGIIRLIRDTKEADRHYVDYTNKYVVTHQGIYKVAFK